MMGERGTISRVRAGVESVERAGVTCKGEEPKPGGRDGERMTRGSCRLSGAQNCRAAWAEELSSRMESGGILEERDGAGSTDVGEVGGVSASLEVRRAVRGEACLSR